MQKELFQQLNPLSCIRPSVTIGEVSGKKKAPENRRLSIVSIAIELSPRGVRRS
jgi:hypothetical protein